MQWFNYLRDDIILNLGREAYPNIDHSFLDEIPRASFPEDDQVLEVPVLLFDQFRKEDKISSFFLDPPHDGTSIVTSQFFKYWPSFVFLLMSEGSDSGKGYWVRAIKDYIEQFGGVKALDFVERLWKYRWINAYDVCAELRIYCKQKVGAYDDLKESDEFWLKEASMLKKEISRTKDQVSNLDEWLEALYLMAPKVVEIEKVLASKPHNEECRKYFRFYAEAIADIKTTRGMVSYFHHHGLEYPMSQQYLPLSHSELKDPSYFDEAVSDIKRELLHNYKGRIVIPKYWYDLALENITTKQTELPTILDSYSLHAFKAIGYFSGFKI